MKTKLFFLFIPVLFGCSSQAVDQTRKPTTDASVSAPFKACPADPERQALRSNELQEIVKADQADRQLPGNQIDWNRVAPKVLYCEKDLKTPPKGLFPGIW